MAALSQGDIVVFGTPWGTLLDPPGLHKYIWQQDLASLPLAASTFTRQMALTSSNAASQPQNSTRQYFFFQISETCLFAIIFQYTLLEGVNSSQLQFPFAVVEVCS